jgi:(R)-2-hydroxyacyl-CoA dehydratese activating ATPase
VFVGIDIGSVTSKAVIIDRENNILAFYSVPTSFDRESGGQKVLDLALQQIGKSKDQIKNIVSTGYGRRSISFTDQAVSEIICHGKGTIILVPDVKTIIDIGGQDSKIIELDEDGKIKKFEMNDKCAAGTGRFFEVLAERILNIDLKELGGLSLQSKNPCTLSSVCTVFAESEIISYLSEHKTREDISFGLNRACAKRVIGMGKAGMISFKEPVVFSGGVAKNIGVVKAIEEELKIKVITLPEPQITAALGAAVIAKESYNRTKEKG